MNKQYEDNNIFEDKDEYDGFDIKDKKRKLISAQYDFSLDFINQQIEKGKIVLDVDFQRNFIWKKDKSSRLIESVLLNVPIPPIYFAEDKDGHWLVLDGLQRLSSINKFYKDEYELSKLTILTDLNEKKYSQIDKYKDQLDVGLLRVNVISKDSDPDIKYDVFMRLNQGAETLNYQELRNCLYRGSFNTALKDMCKTNKIFLEILNEKEPHKRYNDVELILRYFAFSDRIKKNESELRNSDEKFFINGYNGRLVQFLNNYMEQNRDLNDSTIRSYEERFNSTIKKVLIVFGVKEAFRNIVSDNNRVYRTIADFVMTSFERLSEDYIKENKTRIKNELKDFLSNNEELISRKTTDKDVVNKRISNWFSRFEDGIQI